MKFDYDNYHYLKTVKFHSHETEQSVWAEGQIRFLESIASNFPVGAKVLDVGCGDGISLLKLKELDYHAVGIDFNDAKLNLASRNGCTTYNCDMHDMSMFNDDTFDIVISSHSLEHSYDPIRALSEFKRVLNQNGTLYIVVPFPDIADYAIEAHVGRDILGTSDPKNGLIKIVKVLNDSGFNVQNIKNDSFREPEIWITCRKK